MINTSRDLFFDEKDTLARKASRVIFVLPLLVSGLLLGAITIWRDNPLPAVIGALAIIVSYNEFGEKLRSAESSKRAKHQIEELFAMTDMLQAAE